MRTPGTRGRSPRNPEKNHKIYSGAHDAAPSLGPGGGSARPHMRPVDRLDLIKIENVCSSKDTVKRMKRQVADRKKISAHRVSAKDSRQEPMESSEHSAVRNQLNLNLSKSLKRHLTREEMRMANRHEK